MKTFRNIAIVIFVAMLVNITGCTGSQTFTTAAKAGDTVSLMVGYYPDISRQDIIVTFYDANFSLIQTIPAGDPRIRAFVQTYPDPLSKAVIGYETNQDITISDNLLIPQTETLWGYQLSASSGNSKEWFQSMLIIDLPTTLPIGSTSILLSTATTSNLTGTPVTIDILDTNGTSNPLSAIGSGPVSNQQIQSLERAAHYKVTFSGASIPHAIEVNMDHTNAVGSAYVVNPRGDIKSINWTDDGANLKAILMPARNQTLTSMNDFKFYVAGEITGLILDPVLGVKAFDVNGNPITVTTTITP